MESFRNIKRKYFKSPLVGYLIINSLRNKIIDLREIIKFLELDYFVISETKSMKAFHHGNLLMYNIEIRARKDRNCHSSGWLEFFRKGFIC